MSSNIDSIKTMFTFLSSLNHEIRTPLNGIIGYSQLLSQSRLDTIQQSYVNSMNHCCLQLMELINDILDFSKLTTGKATVNNSYFAVSEVKEMIDSTLLYKIKEKNQRFDIVIDKSIPEHIYTDKQKIIQILINLISNSIKFTPKKGRIIVNIEKATDNKIEFIIEDNGIGIKKEYQEKIFEPFFQINPSILGSGLGLSISKKLVELLGGEIKIDSDEGKGAIFSFCIPIQEHITNISPLKDKFILVIDENTEDRLSTSEILFNCSMKVINCSSIKEGNLMIKRFPFVAILISQNLYKELDGIDIPIIGIQKPVVNTKLIDNIIQTITKNDISTHEINTVNSIELEVKEYKILVAEDVSYNLDMLIKMLNNIGYSNITSVSNGEEAIEELKQNSYDLILLDLKMPVMNGFDVLGYIKNNDILIQTVVITASILESDKEKCKELGAKYFLLKPFNMNHLKKILNKLKFGTITR